MRRVRLSLAVAALAAFFVVAVTAGGADTFTVRLVSQTSSTITLGWDPQPGYGYLFSAGGTLVSRTNDASRTSVKFSKVPSGEYDIDVIAKGANGHYPVVVPPPPPPVAACGDGNDNDADGKTDYPADPGCTGLTDTDETDPVPPPPGGQVTVSTTGNDTSCARGGSACRTLTRGYAVALAGDTVTVQAGSYTGGTITGSKQVTFRAAGGTVNVSSRLNLTNVSNVSVYGPMVVKTTDPYADMWLACAKSVDFHDVSGYTVFVYDGSANVSFYGGDWGGYNSSKGNDYGDPAMSGYNGSGSSSCGDGWVRNVLWDGVRFHDVFYGPSSTWGAAHPDCLETYGKVDGITVRNSTFERCGNSFMQFSEDFGSVRNVLVENNLFRSVYDSFWGIQIVARPGDGFTCDLVFRNNTYDVSQGPATDAAARLECPGQQVYGNIFSTSPSSGTGQCVGAWSFNVFELSDICGSGVVGNPAYVNRSAGDYHLGAGSAAAGKGDPSRFPATDFEGTLRSSPPDAGYDEQ